MNHYNSLQIREIFHVEFLRWFSRKFKPEVYALKGGVNIRLFFKSRRYSEDMDLDVKSVSVVTLRDSVMKILTSPVFAKDLKPYGIEEVQPPDITKAKQTGTTQRFKLHLITQNNEDLFTKIEFSRREGKGISIVESIPDTVLRPYKTSPFVISHYDVNTAVSQKIGALAGRSVVQARDIFDLYTLSTQYESSNSKKALNDQNTIDKAVDNLFSVDFNQFRDTVVAYLTDEDRSVYNSPETWDEIKLKVSELICQKKPR
ncbi:MAG TPA: hypothetical protein DEE98_04890 [Elusimicrobia bacterium]|nr:MAG: hypothetical protein A2278_04570 [Elusimicrobia bacterium RIFOXYA12_FULL_49_49]OGS09308.1 MAG: hypothetical protein A2204_06795 [Elusimicrobia bacterium RIFOXYA1_FULL_47_7]OGS14680.1 MAG: hypothetical protein A2251_09270 [Elusimicrobia bacterium RIFOXYA2_FULL_47_53]OGS25668.1 MAG: hypothetical protein A2339_06320 [Elusimicrobia bacterium RIFOXYB12_FULL_50_12]OGS31771.1 MAG: hypothetical protein A2323_06180 [Elusimicrobia bacterium RIFOXYB2_FULL_46_23]HBU69700.1 hypothetical protein [El